MKTIRQIEARREAILEEMGRIRSLERGTINQYFVPVRKKGQSEPQPKGPYYVISRRAGKKTQGYHLKGAAEVSRARRDVESRGRFQELCREYEELTEGLGRLERGMEDAAEREKKPRRSRSSKTRR